MTLTDDTPAAVETPADDPQPVLMQLDPNELIPDPANVRAKVADLKGLTASIKELGVLQPLVVRPTDDDRWQIVAGHRRQQAAILAGLATVPCMARLDLADAPAHVILAALGENLRRADLTDLEEARAYQAVLDLGLSPTRIARLTGSKPARVKKALAVTASEAATEAMTTTVALTLDQAAVIAEFDDDPDTAAYLLEQAQRGDGTFKHAVSAKRRAREDNARRQATADALTAAGITVLPARHEDPDTWPNATALNQLMDPDDTDRNALDAEAHSDCPGHAAIIDPWDHEKAVYYCTDPDAHGHTQRWNNTTTGAKGEPTEAQREAATEERRLVRTNNRAWRDAEPVRREWLRDLLNRKRPPKGCLEFVTAEIMDRPQRIGDGSDAMLSELTGIDAGRGTWGRSVGADLAAKATTARLPLVLLAQVAAALETSMDVQTWRIDKPEPEARWLRFLATIGYTLSDIEQTVADKVFPPASGQTNTDDGENANDEDRQADNDDGEDDDPEDLAAADDHPVTDGRPALTVIAGGSDDEDQTDTEDPTPETNSDEPPTGAEDDEPAVTDDSDSA